MFVYITKTNRKKNELCVRTKKRMKPNNGHDGNTDDDRPTERLE